MRSIALFFFGGIGYVCMGQMTSTEKIQSYYQQGVELASDPIYVGELFPLTFEASGSHPYFQSRSWRVSKLSFNGTEYTDIELIYDLENQHLLVKHPSSFQNTGIRINPKLIEHFEIDGAKFRKPASRNDNLYQEAYMGKHMTILIKRIKTKTTTSEGVQYRELNEFFVETADQFIPVKRIKDLEKVAPNFKAVDKKVKSEDKNLKFSKYNLEATISYLKAFDHAI